MSTEIRILLVDDHALVRDGVSVRLQQEEDFAIVGLANDASEAISMMADRRPDVVLMDIDMPGLSCFEAARAIHAQWPGARIIFLSAFLNDRYVEEALRVRARGYLTKSEPPAALIAAIRTVQAGGMYFSDDGRARLVVSDEGVALAHEAKTKASTLTRRETEILRYLARGLAKKEIAALTHVSIKTVETHTHPLMNKLDLHDRVALTRFAIREGLAEA